MANLAAENPQWLARNIIDARDERWIGLDVLVHESRRLIINEVKA
jgi:hypothetical protein